MISYIKGELADIREDSVIIENNGIGYQIFVPGSTLSSYQRTGVSVKIYTYLYVKEDVLCLYGFGSKEDLEIFKLLLTVSGIGPKGALGILSAISPDDLRFAVLSEDVKTISGAPGIGKKTAQKLIIELKDKISLAEAFEKKLEGASAAAEASGMEEIQSEAVAALVSLGYTQTEALRAVRQVEGAQDMGVEELLKLALRKMI